MFLIILSTNKRKSYQKKSHCYSIAYFLSNAMLQFMGDMKKNPLSTSVKLGVLERYEKISVEKVKVYQRIARLEKDVVMCKVESSGYEWIGH